MNKDWWMDGCWLMFLVFFRSFKMPRSLNESTNHSCHHVAVCPLSIWKSAIYRIKTVSMWGRCSELCRTITKAATTWLEGVRLGEPPELVLIWKYSTLIEIRKKNHNPPTGWANGELLSCFSSAALKFFLSLSRIFPATSERALSSASIAGRGWLNVVRKWTKRQQLRLLIYSQTGKELNLQACPAANYYLCLGTTCNLT